MDSPLALGIVSSVIAAVMVMVALALFSKVSSPGLTIFTVLVSSLIFYLGTFLQSALQAFMEGDVIGGAAIGAFGKFPRLLLSSAVVSGLLPGVITTLGVRRARSLEQRMKHGAFWAPISLVISDTVFVFVSRWTPTAADISFALLCDLVGGVVAGVIIGVAVHMFVEASA